MDLSLYDAMHKKWVFLSWHIFFIFYSSNSIKCLFKMACQSKDLESLRAIQVELWPLFSEEQNQLLHLVITELSHPSGEGL